MSQPAKQATQPNQGLSLFKRHAACRRVEIATNTQTFSFLLSPSLHQSHPSAQPCSSTAHVFHESSAPSTHQILPFAISFHRLKLHTQCLGSPEAATHHPPAEAATRLSQAQALHDGSTWIRSRSKTLAVNSRARTMLSRKHLVSSLPDSNA